MPDQMTAYTVAAFTDQKFAGSPTGVVLNAEGLSDAEMQRIAVQMNCSHTGFVTALAENGCEIGVRFFTPAGEIKNCGHGTIAAHFLRESLSENKRDRIVKQQAKSGIQDVEIRHRDGNISVHLKQDAINFSAVTPEIMEELLAILGLPFEALDPHYPVLLASPGANRFMVALKSTETLNQLTPNFANLKTLSERLNSIGCFVFALDSPVEANARMFLPALGIDEDIINGNSSGCLGAYLLKTQTGESAIMLSVHQGQKFGRPGTVLVEARKIGDQIETIVGGTAVIIEER